MAASMEDVRNAISRRLGELGATVIWNRMTNCSFSWRYRYGEESFRVNSVNPRRMEVEIEHRNDAGFKIAPKHIDGKYSVAKRFKKSSDPATIESILKWVASVHHNKGYRTLEWLLNPKGGIQQPNSFDSNSEPLVVASTLYPANIESVQFMGLATIDGRVVHTEVRDSHNPYLMMVVKLCEGSRVDYGERNQYIITDGDIWYVIWQYRSEHYVIDPYGVDQMVLDQNDRKLIYHIVNTQTDRIMSDD